MDLCEFEARLIYRVSSRTAMATQRNSVMTKMKGRKEGKEKIKEEKKEEKKFAHFWKFPCTVLGTEVGVMETMEIKT